LFGNFSPINLVIYSQKFDQSRKKCYVLGLLSLFLL
jgi:hypothetical protein